MPRIDPETGYGLVTDVCLKRKIRNYVEMAKEGESGYRIYVKDSVPLNRSDAEACAYVGVAPDKLKDAKKKDDQLDSKLRDFMCQNFYDIRTFGAVMTTFVKGALNCGQVRGPVQLGFARSVDPIVPQEVTITRVAITTEADAEKKGTEMGRKYIVPYGLYRAEGYVSANLARRVTGFSAGTGSAFSLLPPQNATGNWIKIVQRVPVRIEIDPADLREHPLLVGLSAVVKVDTSDTSGRLLAASARTEPVPGDLVSQAPAVDFAPVEATISGIIRDNALPGVCPVQGKP